jgi:hypothetical protein
MGQTKKHELQETAVLPMDGLQGRIKIITHFSGPVRTARRDWAFSQQRRDPLSRNFLFRSV